MEEIKIEAAFGEETKLITLSIPSGTSGHYAIMVDKYYNGTLEKRGTEWIGHLNQLSELTSDDIYIMGEILDSKEKASHK
ncbi:hypothetical protein QT327_21220 [Olivibacter sp. 47]|uniref:hypothetical protein n=1 Tax=Olivibacter sp. 47 TaxID=3056486 RepID=UPI0025A486D6|nr:hypothetical protein [Olivibacter sp. 47]MDM8176837.1 hypothetical protein [Olivibacter sp. 47]